MSIYNFIDIGLFFVFVIVGFVLVASEIDGLRRRIKRLEDKKEE